MQVVFMMECFYLGQIHFLNHPTHRSKINYFYTPYLYVVICQWSSYGCYVARPGASRVGKLYCFLDLMALFTILAIVTCVPTPTHTTLL